MSATASTKEKKLKGMTLHVPISGELCEKLDQMRFDDRRQKNDFIRLLIQDEWNRRQPNGAKP